MLALIETGSQLESEGLEQRIIQAEKITLLIDNGKVVATATLKNPLPHTGIEFSKLLKLQENQSFTKKNLVT